MAVPLLTMLLRALMATLRRAYPELALRSSSKYLRFYLPTYAFPAWTRWPDGPVDDMLMALIDWRCYSPEPAQAEHSFSKGMRPHQFPSDAAAIHPTDFYLVGIRPVP
jgi:hypothetical protein